MIFRIIPLEGFLVVFICTVHARACKNIAVQDDGSVFCFDRSVVSKRRDSAFSFDGFVRDKNMKLSFDFRYAVIKSPLHRYLSIDLPFVTSAFI